MNEVEKFLEGLNECNPLGFTIPLQRLGTSDGVELWTRLGEDGGLVAYTRWAAEYEFALPGAWRRAAWSPGAQINEGTVHGERIWAWCHPEVFQALLRRAAWAAVSPATRCDSSGFVRYLRSIILGEFPLGSHKPSILSVATSTVLTFDGQLAAELPERFRDLRSRWSVEGVALRKETTP